MTHIQGRTPGRKSALVASVLAAAAHQGFEVVAYSSKDDLRHLANQGTNRKLRRRNP